MFSAFYGGRPSGPNNNCHNFPVQNGFASPYPTASPRMPTPYPPNNLNETNHLPYPKFESMPHPVVNITQNPEYPPPPVYTEAVRKTEQEKEHFLPKPNL